MQVLTLSWVVDSVRLIQAQALIFLDWLNPSYWALKEVQSISLLWRLLLRLVLLCPFLFWLRALLGSDSSNHMLLFLLLYLIFLIESLAWAQHPSDLSIAFYLWGVISWDPTGHLVVQPNFVQIIGIIVRVFNYRSLFFLVLWLVFLPGVLFHWGLGRCNNVLRHYIWLRGVIAGK